MAQNYAPHFQVFSETLKNIDKEQALNYCLRLLEDGTLSVPALYEEILSPALNQISIPRADEDTLIWQEHAMTAIVRSVVECAYPFVLKEKAKQSCAFGGKVVLVCPEDEYHELGIRMGTDFFTIANFEAVFVGGNTPAANIVSVVQTLKPDIVDIGVSNFLNLVSLKRIILKLREKIDPKIKIAVSGSAFKRTGNNAADFGADIIINSFADILAFGRVNNETGI